MLANQKTHLQVDCSLVGTPLSISEDDYAEAKLCATWEMAVDGHGLVHGAFTFGLADYSAMLAVNHPNVVLASASVNYLSPVKVGDELIAHAKVQQRKNNRRTVSVSVKVKGKEVFSGIFRCVITRKYILA
ncbi:MAG: hotdog domain-containing protein [Candidatus Ranarchaeia archaeon]